MDVPERAFALPLGDMGSIYHVHRFNLRGKLLPSPCVWWSGLLVIVLTLRPLFFVLGIYLAGLFKNPATSVGVIGWFIRGAVYLAWVIEYAVEARWDRIVPFEWILPLARLGAAEYSVYRHVIGIITVVSTLVCVASGLAVAVFGFRSARFTCTVISTG